MSGRLRRATGLLRTVGAPILVGLAGAWLGLALLGRELTTLGPFTVELRAGVGAGETRIALPPLGRIVADTHAGPLALEATLVDAGIEELSRSYRDVSTQELVREVERDAIARVRPFALRMAGVSLLGGAALAVVAFRRRLRPVAVASLAAFAAVGAGEVAAWATFRPDAFLAPTFSGSLSLAPQLVGPVGEATGRIDDFRAELTRIVEGALQVYARIPAGTAAGDEIAVLHISDVHLSPLGLEFAREVADAFAVDLVLDTGDTTSFGTPFESAFLSLVRRFDRPYLLAPGNHDAASVVRSLDSVPNARVLDGRMVDVAGLAIYGRAHPAFTQDKRAEVDDESVEDTARAEAGEIAADLATFDEPPDIVAVHDDRMVESLAGAFPLVVSGHFHRPSAAEREGTIFLRVGSTGGAGFTVFTDDGGAPLSLQVLYLSRREPHRLVAWDVIEQSAETGSLTLERHRVADEFEDAPPAPGPSPPG